MPPRAFDTVRPPGDGLAVLAYHRVGAGSGLTTDLPTALFADQLAYLAERYQAITLGAAADALEAGVAPRGKAAFVLTFDDGTGDFVEEVLPVLVVHGLPCTVYLATDHVERGLPFPNAGTPVSWSALRDAVSTGLVTVGSHTHTHLLLDRVSGAVAADELDRSVDLIADRLGVAARHFAYPKALPGSIEAEAEVARRFRTAALSGTRLNPWAGTDLLRLSRTPVQVTDGIRWFKRKVDGGLRLEGTLRAGISGRRYSEAVS